MGWLHRRSEVAAGAAYKRNSFQVDPWQGSRNPCACEGVILQSKNETARGSDKVSLTALIPASDPLAPAGLGAAELDSLVDCRVDLSGQVQNIARTQDQQYTRPKTNPAQILPGKLLLDVDEPHSRGAIHTS